MADAKQGITSQHVLSGVEPIKWLYREEPAAPEDNGWRFLAEDDDVDYMSDLANVALATTDEILAVLPEFVEVENFPTGTDLQVVTDEAGTVFFYDNHAGIVIE